MRSLIALCWRPTVILLFLVVLSAGCAATRIEYFTDETYLPHDTAEWLDTEPTRPHIELARIIVSSSNLSADRLRQALLERARTLGADAVVGEMPAMVMQATGSPYYEPGLLGPAGAAFGLYGYGWYTPFTSNP